MGYLSVGYEFIGNDTNMYGKYIFVYRSPNVNCNALEVDNSVMENFDLHHSKYINYKAILNCEYIISLDVWIPRFIVKPYYDQPTCKHEECHLNYGIHRDTIITEDIAYGITDWGHHGLSFSDFVKSLIKCNYHPQNFTELLKNAEDIIYCRSEEFCVKPQVCYT